MIKYILSFLLIANTANAVNSGTRTIQANEIDGVMGFKNLVENSGFERKARAWTASGGTFTTTTTAADVGSGSRAGSWDSNAASQTLTSTAVAIPAGDYGANYEVSANLKCASGTCTHLLQAYDGTNVIASTTITSSSTYTRTTLNFVSPTSGNISARIVSVASDEPNIFIDDGYLGRARNVGSVAQAELVGTVKITGCSSYWSTTSGSYSDFSPVSGCSYAIEGSGIQAPATNLPGFRLTGPPGKYVFVASGAPNVISSAGTYCAYRMTDGTTPSREENWGPFLAGSIAATFEFTIIKDTPINSSSFRMQAYRHSGSGSCVTWNDISGSLVFKIYRYPLSSEIAVRPETQQNFGQAIFTAGSVNFGPSSASYTNVTGSGIFGSKTFIGKASACTDGNAVCARFNALPAGNYAVVVNGPMYNASNSTFCYYRISDGSTHSNEVALYDHTSLSNISSATFIISYSSQGDRELTVQARRSGGSSCNWQGAGLPMTSTMTLIPLSQSLPAPNLVGSVTSLSTGSLRDEAANVANSTTRTAACVTSPCTINIPTSTWLTSVTRSSAGIYAATITSGVFSSAPVCLCTGSDTSSTSNRFVHCNASSATNIDIHVKNSADNYADTAFNIRCLGPRGSL